MGVRDRLAAWLARKENPVAKLIVHFFGLGDPVWTEQDFYNLSKEGFAQNVWVYKCVDITAQAVAGVPWLVYERKRSGGLREIEDPRHPLVRLLSRPNPTQGRASFFYALTAYLRLAGNSYIAGVGPKTGPNAGQFRELWPLRPDRVEVLPHPTKLVGGYVYRVNGEKKKFEAEHVLHLKQFHPIDDFYGLSTIQVAARSVDLDNAADSWNTSLLQNQARPPGALMTEKNLTPDEFNELRKQFEEKYAGARNAGRPLILSGGLKWQQIGLSPTDMDWVKLKSITRLQICTAFGVPPELLGDHEHATYSNYQEARKGFYHETILPLLDFIRDELNAWLTPRFGDRLYLDYDIDAIEAIQEDREKVWTMALDAVRTGVLTINEARNLMGYDDADGGDVRLVPANAIPEGPDADEDDARAQNDGEDVEKGGGSPFAVM